MKKLLFFSSLLIGNYAMCQSISLKINTDQFVDSVYFAGKSNAFDRINDTLIQVDLDFSQVSGDQDEVSLYSAKRIYKTSLSAPKIKSMLSSKYQNRGQLTMQRNKCTELTIDGYSVHQVSSLVVFALKKEKLLVGESCGVHIVR